MSSVYAVPVNAQDGYWVAVSVDYFTNLEILTNHSAWTFNASRGSNDRWGINYTISGFGFHPTTVIICDEDAYRHWIDTGATDQCHFLWHVNYSLHISVDIPHHSQWYIILNNTGPVTLYFSLQLTHYQWSTTSTTPSPNLFEGISNLIVNLVIIGIIVFVLIPCICRFNCFGFFRRKSKGSSSKKEANSQTVILVITPEQLEQYIEEDENS
jgi:hypothetical protein